MPDFLCDARHIVHALLPSHAGTVGAVCKLVCIVAEARNLTNKFRMMRAGTGMDFLTQDKGAQIFLAC